MTPQDQPKDAGAQDEALWMNSTLKTMANDLEEGRQVHLNGDFLRRVAAEISRLTSERDALREALRDMNAGWKYIRQSHGDLYGVGWDRAQGKADAALALSIDIAQPSAPPAEHEPENEPAVSLASVGQSSAISQVFEHLEGQPGVTITTNPPQSPPAALSEREFSEWLNDNRNRDVSSIFHDTVAHYAAALSSTPATEQPDSGLLPPAFAFILNELHAFQEATGCDTANQLQSAKAAVPLSDDTVTALELALSSARWRIKNDKGDALAPVQQALDILAGITTAPQAQGAAPEVEEWTAKALALFDSYSRYNGMEARASACAVYDEFRAHLASHPTPDAAQECRNCGGRGAEGDHNGERYVEVSCDYCNGTGFAAPTPDAAQPEVVAYLDIGAGGYIDLGSELSDEKLQALPFGRHALAIVGTFGVDGFVAHPTPDAAQGEQP